MGGPSLAAVLFTDLVGSTAQRSDPGEQADEELRRIHDRLLGEAVEAHGNSTPPTPVGSSVPRVLVCGCKRGLEFGPWLNYDR